MRAGFLCPNCGNLVVYIPAKIKMSFIWKDVFFLPYSASSVNRSQAHLAKRKRIWWSIGFNSWTNSTSYWVIPRSLCKICPNDVSEMFNCREPRCIDVDDASHTHFLSHQQYSRVYALLLALHALFYRWGCQFLSLFSQDNEHTELTVLLFFQYPYAIFAHIQQHITMIFKIMSQYFPALFSSVYTTICVRLKDKTNYLSKQTWAMCYHVTK